MELFTTGKDLGMEDCLGALDKKVSLEMNQKLLVDFTTEKITSAMHQMPPKKAPGPNGFSACFYQFNWATVHSEVCTAILHFLNMGEMDKKINITYIALIPKVQNLMSVTNFRPICVM
jgi:hypothetical protein